MTPNLKLQEAIKAVQEFCSKAEFEVNPSLENALTIETKHIRVLLSAAQSIIAEECPECAKLRGKIAVLMSERPDMVLENAKLRKKIDDLYQFGKKECKLPKPSGEVTKIVRTANNEIIAITYEGKQYYPKELHPAIGEAKQMTVDQIEEIINNSDLVGTAYRKRMLATALYEAVYG